MGWVEVKIGEVFEIVSGGTPKSSNDDFFTSPPNGFAWLTPADLSGYQEKYISHGKRNLTESGYKNCSAKLMPKGSVVFSSRAPIGYVAIANNEICTNQGFKSFVANDFISSDYLYYYLKSIRDLADSLGTGTTFKEISATTCKKLPFILPPKAEQDHIATLLDNDLSQVAKIEQKLKDILPIIKQFRQSVLAQAVSGKLTEDWRNRSDLSEWQLKKIQEIAQDVTYGYTASSTQEDTGFKLVRITDLQNNDINWDTVPFCEVSEKDFQKYQVKENDLLFARTGATVGKSHLVQEVPFNAVYASYLIRVRLKNNYDMKYISYYFQSPQYWNDITELSAGIGQPNVNGTKLKNLQINLPPLPEQQQIVTIVERLFAVADTIETQVNEALERVGHLTQSILHQAFTGNLSADWRACNAELITGEHSATALLAKIQDSKQPTKRKKADR